MFKQNFVFLCYTLILATAQIYLVHCRPEQIPEDAILDEVEVPDVLATSNGHFDETRHVERREVNDNLSDMVGPPIPDPWYNPRIRRKRSAIVIEKPKTLPENKEGQTDPANHEIGTRGRRKHSINYIRRLKLARSHFPDSFCLLEVDSGVLCPGFRKNVYMEQFVYDDDLNHCYSFNYYGCGGNANRFSSMLECETTCVEWI